MRGWPEDGGWAATYSQKTGHNTLIYYLFLIVNTDGTQRNPLKKREVRKEVNDTANSSGLLDG